MADITLFEFSTLYFLSPLFHLSLLFLAPSLTPLSLNLRNTRILFTYRETRKMFFQGVVPFFHKKYSFPPPSPPPTDISPLIILIIGIFTLFFTHPSLAFHLNEIFQTKSFSSPPNFSLPRPPPPSGRQRFPKIHPEYLAFPLKSRRGNGIRVLSAPWKGAYPR